MYQSPGDMSPAQCWLKRTRPCASGSAKSNARGVRQKQCRSRADLSTTRHPRRSMVEVMRLAGWLVRFFYDIGSWVSGWLVVFHGFSMTTRGNPCQTTLLGLKSVRINKGSGFSSSYTCSIRPMWTDSWFCCLLQILNMGDMCDFECFIMLSKQHISINSSDHINACFSKWGYPSVIIIYMHHL